MKITDLSPVRSEPKKLYYFGRSALWVFLGLLATGIYLRLAPADQLGLEGAPAFILMYVVVLKTVLPFLSPFGLIASLGIMRQKNWARHLMVAVLVLGLIGLVAYGIGFIIAAWTAPSSKFRGGDKVGVIFGSLTVLGIYLAGMLWCIAHIRSAPFVRGSASPAGAPAAHREALLLLVAAAPEECHRVLRAKLNGHGIYDWVEDKHGGRSLLMPRKPVEIVQKLRITPVLQVSITPAADGTEIRGIFRLRRRDWLLYGCLEALVAVPFVLWAMIGHPMDDGWAGLAKFALAAAFFLLILPILLLCTWHIDIVVGIREEMVGMIKKALADA